jgi:hypothetical protein
MRFQQKYLLIGAVLIMMAVIHQQYTANNNLSHLLKAYELEAQIQDRQLIDISSQIRTTQAEEYNKGFEHGKTQAAITLMNEESLNGYTEGYHAAIDQFDGKLAVNPFEEKFDEDYKYALEILSESIKREENIEKAYLEIIEMITSTEEDQHELPDLPEDPAVVELD